MKINLFKKKNYFSVDISFLFYKPDVYSILFKKKKKRSYLKLSKQNNILILLQLLFSDSGLIFIFCSGILNTILINFITLGTYLMQM